MAGQEKKTIPSVTPKTKAQWRKWLKENHQKAEAVWLIYHKKNSKTPSALTWSDAVDEALCFGWIDSKRQTVDEFTFRQFFAKRKARGTWSKINKEKIERLIRDGLMAKAGLDAIENAKRNGSWTLLDEVEELIMPPDLEKALKKVRGAYQYFTTLSRSPKRNILQWLVLAKRPETRAKRIKEIATLAGKGKRPAQFS